MARFFAALLASIIGFFGFHATAPMPADATPIVAESRTGAASSTGAGVSASAHAQSSAQGSAVPVGVSSTGSGDASASGIAKLTGSSWLTTLPLGDGKYVTDAPKQGYVYLCHVATGGGGAQGKATWISGNVWYPDQKVAVEGEVAWPSANYDMKLSGATRTVTANGLPTDHTTGIFPIQRTDPAYQFDANPNSIETQSYSFSFPAYPTELANPDCIYGQVGIMNDGVPLFDGFDAEYRDAVAHETQDKDDGHPQEAGEYHYHGFETGPVKESASTVVGFAFDGFPITGSALSDGTYLHSADLDECHGTTSAITLDGAQMTTYHYVLTQDFPYAVACFRGKSYEPKPGAGGQQSGTSGQAPPNQGQQSQGGMTPPSAAIAACASANLNAACSFSTPNGAVSGSCQTTPGGSVACVPAR